MSHTTERECIESGIEDEANQCYQTQGGIWRPNFSYSKQRVLEVRKMLECRSSCRCMPVLIEGRVPPWNQGAAKDDDKQVVDEDVSGELDPDNVRSFEKSDKVEVEIIQDDRDEEDKHRVDEDVSGELDPDKVRSFEKSDKVEVEIIENDQDKEDKQVVDEDVCRELDPEEVDSDQSTDCWTFGFVSDDADEEDDIKSADIKSADIKCADIKNAAIKNADIKNADIENTDIKNADIKSGVAEFDSDEECRQEVKSFEDEFVPSSVGSIEEQDDESEYDTHPSNEREFSSSGADHEEDEFLNTVSFRDT
ncbi:MAG: hypothetical protein M1837_005293 [Sclerophora amabilis]|nr:MAG: hypothetical protein M1837_005293 [Sclerophora amabilis]